MMHEEEYIREKMGTRNPFSVPEGFFDQLANEVISKLPAEAETHKLVANDIPKPAMVRYLRPLLYAAACIALVITMGTVVLTKNQDNEQFVAHQETTDSDTYFDEMADYAMLDNEDIYASLLADL